MSDTINLDDHLLPGFVASTSSKLKANIQAAKKLNTFDGSKFKVGFAYRLKADKDKALLINELGPHPISRLQCGYGLLISQDGYEPGYIHLHELAEVFNL